jgi:hypothetical protein
MKADVLPMSDGKMNFGGATRCIIIPVIPGSVRAWDMCGSDVIL